MEQQIQPIQPTTPMTLSKDRVKEIISKAPKGTNPVGIVAALREKGYTLEGYPATTPTQTPTPTSTEQPKSIGGFLGNIVSSGAGFLESAGQAIAHPIKTLENISKLGAGAVETGLGKLGAVDISGVPLENKTTEEKQIFGNVVDYFGKRYGGKDINEIASNVANTAYKDPVGFLVDLSTVAGGVEGIAGKVGEIGKVGEVAGKVGEIAGKTSKLTDVIGATGKAIAKTPELIGKAGKSILGLTTRRGGESIAQAFEAGVEGGKSNKSFLDALRGKTSSESIIEESKSALGNIIKQRSDEYINQMNKLKVENPKALDISPVVNKSEELKNSFGIKTSENGELDFSRSPLVNDQNKIKAVLNIVDDWGKQAGDRTVVGIDLLKRQLRDFREVNNAPLNKFIDTLANETKGILTKNVKGYSELESGYASKTELIKEISKDFSLGQKSTVEQGLKKMTQALKTDNTLKTDLLKQLEEAGGNELIKKISGMNLGKALPDDIFRASFDFYKAFQILGGASPLGALEIMSTMPRLVGEVVNKIGVGMRPAAKISELLKKFDELKKAGKFATVAGYYEDKNQ